VCGYERRLVHIVFFFYIFVSLFFSLRERSLKVFDRFILLLIRYE
jgi:hypothetical protein